MNIFSFFEKQNKKYRSKINTKVSVGKLYGNKTLFAGGVSQSGGEYVVMWEECVKRIMNQESGIRDCLVLGVGGGDVIKTVKKYYPKVHITGVEIDPVIVEIAREHFKLDMFANKIYVEDAIKWVQKPPFRGRFDLIVVDVYIGRFNVIKARKKAFLQTVKNLLTKNGIILYNCHYDKNNSEDFDKFIKICRFLFKTVDIIFSYPLNRILILK